MLLISWRRWGGAVRGHRSEVRSYDWWFVLTHVGGAAGDVVVNRVSGVGGRGAGACPVRRDVDGVFAGQKHPARRACSQGRVRAQRGVVHLQKHTHK